jgi:Zn-dependent protease with chaperone function
MFFSTGVDSKCGYCNYLSKYFLASIYRLITNFSKIIQNDMMKALSVFISLYISIITTGIAQKKATFACNYTGAKVNEEAICGLLGFRSKPEASKAIEEIVRRSGLKQNFYVMECPNTDNCYAVTQNGERIIVYDAKFMQKINDMTKTDWGALSILAHEIGHHLQGHTLKVGGSDYTKEIEADEFSGFVMYQMGASLKQAQTAIWMLTTDNDSGTHPPRNKRIRAIEKGYKNAEELYPRVNQTNKPEKVSEIIEEKPISKPNTNPKVEKVILVEVESTEAAPEEIIEKKTGCITGNCLNGSGVAINSKSMEKYDGEWTNGKRNGHGIEYYADGQKKYQGQFYNSVYHGTGTYFFKTGERYLGNFKNGKMHGNKSQFHYRNGNQLIVDYVNGKKQGKAKIIYWGGVEGIKFFKDDIEIK